MDINDHLQPLVASIIDNLTVTIGKEVRDQVTAEVINKVASTEITSIVREVTTKQLEERLGKQNFEATTIQEVNAIVKRISEQVNGTVVKSATDQITNAVNEKLRQVDVNSVIAGIVETKVKALVASGGIPERSIPHTSINFKGIVLSGENIKGGIIEGFGSTGIEDLATAVKLSVLDNMTVSANPLIAPAANIKGKLTVEGDLVLKGAIDPSGEAIDGLATLTADKVRATLNEELFQSFSDIITKNINEQGLDLNKITQGGREIVNNSQLGYHITDTNIQRLGMVRDFQTQGENLLSDTLYVTPRRVGINTMDPSTVFVVWDEEVEIVVTKRTQDTGFVGTTRNQRLILGSNSKDNITLNTDGSVEIENLRVGNVPMSSASTIPNYEDITGTIVWNENPAPGSVIGWVCLGGSRWAKFGTIE